MYFRGLLPLVLASCGTPGGICQQSPALRCLVSWPSTTKPTSPSSTSRFPCRMGVTSGAGARRHLAAHGAGGIVFRKIGRLQRCALDAGLLGERAGRGAGDNGEGEQGL